jgi:hypothetical protein
MEVRIDTSEDAKLRTLLENSSRMQLLALARFGSALAEAGKIVTTNAGRDRFSGKGPFPVSQHKLGVRSGRLKKSLRCSKPQLNLRTGEIAMQFGSNMVYFAVHEFGFKGQVGVRQHTRSLMGKKTYQRGRLTKGYQNRLKKKLKDRHFEGSKGKTATQVRAHRRRVDMPARAPFGTELRSERTTAAFMMALKKALLPLLKDKK